MQKAEIILAKLNEKSRNDKTYTFKRLYRNLYNIDFYLYAYAKIYKNEGNMTEGVDGKTIDGFNKRWIQEIINLLKYEKYHPTPVRRTYIPKKNGKLRPLGIPAFKDKVVQEVLKEILEAIYEPTFSKNSHGFRPDRSCHTALYQIKSTGTGSSWAIEGDITGFFDTINHDKLLSILKRKIDDGRILELIRRFLKAGYLEDGIKRDTITGTPQGGIISPILANIYLNELDDYMETVIEKHTKGKSRKENPEYKKLNDKCLYMKRTGRIEEAHKLRKIYRQMPSRMIKDPDYIRVRYVRYADDFVVFIIGSKNLAITIKEEISGFLKKNLNLELNNEKTVITNLLKDKVKFLGYEINKVVENTQIGKTVTGAKQRSINNKIQIYFPIKTMYAKAGEFRKNSKPYHKKDRVNLNNIEILNKYNSEIRGLYNYYCLAINVAKMMHKYKYYHYFSLLKTIGLKEKKSIRKIIAKYGISVPNRKHGGTKNIFGIKYITKSGRKILTYFDEPLTRKKYPIDYVNGTDYKLNNERPYNELLMRLNYGKCELCGNKTDGDIVVHHVRKLKELTNQFGTDSNKIPKWVKIMQKIRRKTLVVCRECHNKIHNK